MEQIAGISITNELAAWEACEFAHNKGVETVIITSCLAEADKVFLMASTVTAGDKQKKKRRYVVEIPLIEGDFGGTGDLMAGLLLAWSGICEADKFARALELSCATLHAVLLRTKQQSRDGDNNELRLIQSQDDIKFPPVERFNIKAVERVIE